MLMYIMLPGFVVDVYNSLSLTSLSLLYIFVNVLYKQSLFLLQNPFSKEWLRLVKLCYELLYIISFVLYAISMALFDATEHNVSVSHIRYIWTLFPAEHVLPCMVTLCNAL
jgi:hypothetical protein